jgi:hypothetical protein
MLDIFSNSILIAKKFLFYSIFSQFLKRVRLLITAYAHLVKNPNGA